MSRTIAVRVSELFLKTYREDPADAEVASHKLLARGRLSREDRLRDLHLDADALAGGSQDHAGDPRGDGSIRGSGDPDAHPATLRALAGEWPTRGIFAGENPVQPRGSQGGEVGPRPDPRRGRHRSGPSPGFIAQGSAGHPVPATDEVPGRDPPSLRAHARPRIHDEGCVLLRRGRRGPGCFLREDEGRLPPHLPAARPAIRGRRRRLRRDRRQWITGIHGDGGSG